MTKIMLVLLDEDAYFGEMLSAYVRSSEYAERFSIRVFTSMDEGVRFVEQNKEPLIIMVNESLMPLPDAVFGLKPGCTVMISDSAREGGLLEYPIMFKYQPLDRLLSGITAHYNEFCAGEPLRGNRGAKTVAVYSAVGGAGKTVTAVHLAYQLAQQGERVFCLGLELLPSRAWYVQDGPEEAESFSQLLYYAKTAPTLISSKLEGLKRKHPDCKFDYVPPSMHLKELAEMEASDLKHILQGIEATRMYDRIVIDLDSMPHAATREALQAADLVLWLLLDDCVHLSKNAELLRSWTAGERTTDWLHRVRFVHNKNAGQTVNRFETYGFAHSSELPYVPEWKGVGRVEDMMSPVFALAAAGLVRAGEEGSRYR
ncbi:hypothetical protein AV654_13640 [Paenibacillus elgii]|uniref:AAA domain-containing protein n=1 Tax=Paenibacillus elgii TaxID=189691 RepID=A0A163YQE2_9BACL|nr:AAA family ATPase [Paenibacillus elgii]KZE80038.1 hypothetical protein AV654_13640 [Paenibacillus elgii]